MLKGRELAAFRKQLLAWFRQFQRDLPWRHTRAPYCVWLSEIMLQQTRVAPVIPYYERFLERFPNVQALAAAPEEEVLRVWSGLGYYSRARNLYKAAQKIVSKHGGEFPSRVEDDWRCRELGNTRRRLFSALLSGRSMRCWTATWRVFLRVWELFAEICAQAVVGNSCRNARTLISTRDRRATGIRR